jgi:hypothetical protein
MKKADKDFDVPFPSSLVDPKGQEIWQAFAGKKIKSLGRLVMLERALLLLQRVKKTEGIIDQEGLCVPGEKMAHGHPLLKTLEKDLQILSRMWVVLGLNGESTVVGLEDFRIE